jgi:AAA ATPase domain
MGPTLSAVLDDARRRGFVGRAPELRSFTAALAGTDPARVLFVHGPGGIGKSTLLDELRRRAVEAGRPALLLHGRDLGGSIEDVATAVAALPDGPGPVLLVDGYELLSRLDRWFREHLLPSLPADSVVVLAGREPPDPGWSADPGWRQLLRRLDLAVMPPVESLELLCRLGVPEDARGRLATLGRGHPLTLTLLAEACAGGAVPSRLEELPQLVAELCRVLVREVPDADHRTGLATCAHAYRTTEDLLAATVGPRAPEVWAWLEARPFVGRSGDGLHLHDLVRDVFDAEFAQRNPDAYVSLHRTMRQHAVSRLLDPASVSRHRDAMELMLLHRRSPLEPQVRQLRDSGVLAMVPAAPADRAGVLEIASAAEGQQAAEMYGRWIDAQPAGLYVARSETGVEAFALHIYVSAEDNPIPEDPVVRAVLEAIERRSPLRPGERVGIGRGIGNRGRYQRDALAVLAGSVSSLVEWLSRPVAWTVVTPSYEDFWRPFFEYLGFGVLARMHFGDRDLTAYGWDRRRLPLEQFLELTGRRELTGETGPPPAELLRPAPLGRAAFDEAVRAALRDVNRPDRLAAGPLAGTALGPDLRVSLLAGIARLGDEPKGEPLRRVLERTYLRGAPSQEAAAEVLGLPFSTYRRYLARATARLVDLLWAVEVGTG